MSKNISGVNKVKSILIRTGSLWTLLVLFIALIIATDQFLTVENLINIARQVVITAVLGIGVTFVIIGGGIDLSVGALLALSSAYSASMMLSSGSVVLALVVGAATGVLFGLLQGVIITHFNVAPFAITLGGMSIFRGMTMLFTNGIPISKLPDNYRWAGAGNVGIIPAPVIILIIVAAIGYIVLSKTKVGRYIYAIGANENTSRLTGINVNFYRVLTYVISGLCCAIAGVLLVGRINSASPSAGSGYEMNAIAAAVIGGTSLQGGEGSISGTIIGALIIGMIQNGLNLLQINAFWQNVAVGLVIIIAIILDHYRVKMTNSMSLLTNE